MTNRAHAVTSILLAVLLGCTLPVNGAETRQPSPALSVAKALSEAYAEVVQKVVPSVVGIRRIIVSKTTTSGFSAPKRGDPFDRDDMLRRFFERTPRFKRRIEGYGSGVVIDPKGHILTNNHVVKNADKLTVEFNDGTKAEAKIVGRDPKTDIAVIKLVNCTRPLTPAVFGDSDKLKVGNIVLAVGSPFRLKHSVTIGIVSAKNRDDLGMNMYESYIQTDASINPGNSGGPLVDLDGRVIGINTLIHSRSGGSDGIGFAVPINMIKDVVRQLIKSGSVTRGWLGVGINDVTPEMAKVMPGVEGGVAITEVYEGTPAAAGGARAGDVIVKFGGKTPASSRHLQQLVANTAPGTTVPVQVVRKGKKVTLQIKIGKQPADLTGRSPEEGFKPETIKRESENGRIGIKVRNITDRLRKLFGLPKKDKGVVVLKVLPGSPADEVGMGPGAMILELDQQRTPDLSAFDKIAAKLEKKKSALIFFRQDGHNRFGVLHFK